jgi:hypothetical protein
VVSLSSARVVEWQLRGADISFSTEAILASRVYDTLAEYSYWLSCSIVACGVWQPVGKVG